MSDAVPLRKQGSSVLTRFVLLPWTPAFAGEQDGQEVRDLSRDQAFDHISAVDAGAFGAAGAVSLDVRESVERMAELV